MTTYNTGNPLGSVDVRDLYDNAQNLDYFSNGTAHAYPDRLGASRKSVAGMEAEFDADQALREEHWEEFLAGASYQILGPYAAGLQFTAMNQVFSYLGEFYAPGPSITLPYTTTGVGAAEIANFRSVGDAVLRQDLANPNKGAVMVARGVVAVESIADLLALPEGQWMDGQQVSLASYHTPVAGTKLLGGGVFTWDSTRDKSDHNGGTVIDPSLTFPADWTSTVDVASWFAGSISGTGCFVRTEMNTTSICDFGATRGTAFDSSVSIRQALLTANHCTVPEGEFRCDEMIDLNSYKTLELSGGTTLRRYATESSSTDPVIWIRGENASLIGSGQTTSRLLSENKTPRGVVRLGHKDMSESHANVTYCTVRGLDIVGQQEYGQTSGEPDVCLYMPNPQFNDLASYFHNISDLRLYRANYGIHLSGWANANTFHGIQGYKLGNVASGHNALIYNNGGLDNSFSQFFFHGSPDSVGIVSKSFDNTSAGGSLHVPNYNSYNGIVCEQGGTQALAIKHINGGANFYEIRNNTAAGNLVPSDFYTANTLFQPGNQGNFSQISTTRNSDGLLASFTGFAGVGCDIFTGTFGGVALSTRIRSNAGNRNLQLEVTGAGNLLFNAGDTERLRIESTGAVRAGADNTQSLGSAAYRWSQVYAGVGVISTSDEREKEQQRGLSVSEGRVAASLKPLLKAFKWTDAVQEKGSEARWHFGIMAQDVVLAFEAEGLDAHQYGMLCYDEWDEQVEVVSDEGDVVTPYQPAGNRYGVRYEELLAFIISAL